MNINQNVNGRSDTGEQELLFEEVICSPEFPQICIDPQER